MDPLKYLGMTLEINSTNASYYAHSAPSLDESHWQLLSDHLQQVGKLASAKASHFGGGDWAEICGLLHDLGKYCEEFQKRLRGSQQRVDHSTWGARVVSEKYDPFGYLLAYCIAGHHAGLADGLPDDYSQKVTCLRGRLRAKLLTELDEIWRDEIQLPATPSVPSMTPQPNTGSFSISVLGRMLFSCLVDADFLDTEKFYNMIDGEPPREDKYPSLAELKDEFDRYLSLPQFQGRDGINKIRHQILTHSRNQARLERGLFSMNVPTGGGKTLSSVAFALDHAVQHNLRRIIVVIPFTSIIEQNARVLREAFGPLGTEAVLEHHSTFDTSNLAPSNLDASQKLRYAAENWEAPIVVTTAVQFFESLFSNRPSRCRKLHNIANSVIILDEAQTLPSKLLRPCVAMIKELATNYRSSVVICTATQPALLAGKDGFQNGLENVREIAPAPDRLHEQLKRVIVEHVGDRSDDELVNELLSERQVLCIVNNRRHARHLYEQMERGGEGTYHLSTLMCAEHRGVQLAKISDRLAQGKTCRLISTSLIEAGVDIDFPVVYRAEAGLDSIAQAAGRCNREGRQSVEKSAVRVFSVADDWKAPPELEQYASAFRTVLRRQTSDLLALDAIREYFTEVYWLKGNALDHHGLLSNLGADIKGIPYEFLANKFQMIESNTIPVIVPYVDNESASGAIGFDDTPAGEAVRNLQYSEYVGGAARQLQRYLVQVPKHGLDALMAAGAVSPINEERFGHQFLLLENWSLYDRHSGLSWDDPSFLKAEESVI